MGFTAKEFFKGLLKKGLMISVSDGKMFDPTDQVRTDAVQDIVKSKSKKEKAKWDSWTHGKNGR